MSEPTQYWEHSITKLGEFTIDRVTCGDRYIADIVWWSRNAFFINSPYMRRDEGDTYIALMIKCGYNVVRMRRGREELHEFIHQKKDDIPDNFIEGVKYFLPLGAGYEMPEKEK